MDRMEAFGLLGGVGFELVKLHDYDDVKLPPIDPATGRPKINPKTGEECRPIAKGKAPFEKDWTKIPADNAAALLYAKKNPKANIGIRLTRRLLVVDVDPRNFKNGVDSLALLSADAGYDFSDHYPRQVTGSGGLHLFFKKPVDLDFAGTVAKYPGLEFKTAGTQVVGAGSIHPETRKPYTFEVDPFGDMQGGIEGLPDVASGTLSTFRNLIAKGNATGDPEDVSGARGMPSVPGQSGLFSDDQLEKFLARLNPEDYRDYDKWFNLMCASHDATGGSGAAVFIAWSIEDPFYVDAAEEIQSKWNGLNSEKGVRITFKSLQRELKAAGAGDIWERGAFEDMGAAAARDFADADESGGSASDDPTGVMAIGGKDVLDAPPPKLPEKKQLTPDEVLLEMCKNYIAILNMGKFEIWQRNYDPVFKRKVWQAMSKQAFIDYFQDEKILVGEKWTTKANLFLNSNAPQKKKYRGVVFDPQQLPSSKGLLNLWEGFAVKPVPGDWSKLYDLILDVLCDGSQERADYVLNWIANMFQFPWKVAGSSIIFKGKEGTGKGTLGRALMHITGAHGLTLVSASQVTGRFNAHLRNVLFLFSDEVSYKGNRAAEGILKALITEPIFQYEQKNKDPGNAQNVIHVMQAANEDWLVPAGESARRFFVSDVSPKRIEDFAYFKAIAAELEAGGYEAFLHDMLARDLTDWRPGHIPNTQALAEQKLLSLTPPAKFWQTFLADGDLTRLMHTGSDVETDTWETEVAVLDKKMRDKMVALYRDFLKTERLYGNATHNALINEGKKFGLSPKTRDKRGERTWSLPVLYEMRAAFEAHFKAEPGSVFGD